MAGAGCDGGVGVRVGVGDAASMDSDHSAVDDGHNGQRPTPQRKPRRQHKAFGDRISLVLPQ